MQGRSKREKKPMTEKVVCVGVDVAKNTLEVAASNLNETRQFENDHKGITGAVRCGAVRYIASLKPIKLILEATGNQPGNSPRMIASASIY